MMNQSSLFALAGRPTASPNAHPDREETSAEEPRAEPSDRRDQEPPSSDDRIVRRWQMLSRRWEALASLRHEEEARAKRTS